MGDGARTIDEAWLAKAPPNEAGGREAIARLLLVRSDQRPTAIFAASLLGAIGVLAGVREAGFAVPGDISLIAFNDHPLAAHLSPPLTTIRMPNHRMGTEAVRMLLDAVDGKPVHDLMVDDKPEIVIRSSTASPVN
jgi:LacI family transcriptional regulator